MRLVFLGTSEFAVPSLRALSASRHEVGLVVTQPDRPAGRSKKPAPPPVKVAAEELGLPVIQPERVNTRAAREAIRRADPDVCVVVAFGQILRPKLLELAPYGCLNVHGSLLPRHRGASPIAGQILAGDDPVGVTVMQMDEGLDTGPILAQRALPACPRETAAELHDRLALAGADLVVWVLDRLEGDGLEPRPQDEARATKTTLLRKEDGWLDFSLGADELDRRIRAFQPWPGAFTELLTEAGPRRIVVLAADPLAGVGEGGEPGEVIAVGPEGIVVACGEGALRIRSLKPAGKRAMSVADFLNGCPVRPRDRFRRDRA